MFLMTDQTREVFSHLGPCIRNVHNMSPSSVSLRLSGNAYTHIVSICEFITLKNPLKSYFLSAVTSCLWTNLCNLIIRSY